jgi:hypothetical protein
LWDTTKRAAHSVSPKDVQLCSTTDSKWGFSVDKMNRKDENDNSTASPSKLSATKVLPGESAMENKKTMRGAAGETIEVTMVDDDYTDSTSSHFASKVDSLNLSRAHPEKGPNAASYLRPSPVRQRDFVVENRGIHPSIFKETFVCPHPHCGQIFSRNYTFKVHLKTHELFPQYHEFKKKPQLGLDTVT